MSKYPDSVIRPDAAGKHWYDHPPILEYKAVLQRDSQDADVLQVDIYFRAPRGEESRQARRLARKFPGLAVESVHQIYWSPPR